jgi:creatinine amidohydrolase
MTSEEFMEAVDDQSVVIVPAASTEQLGPHGPLGADVFAAEKVSELLAERAGCMVGPTVPVGEAGDMMGWPGTLTVRSDVLREIYLDLCRSYAHHGVRRIFFFTAHLGNLRAVEHCGKAMRRRGVLVSQVDWWRAAARAGSDLFEDEIAPTGHGGEMITSVVMALRPELVRLEGSGSAGKTGGSSGASVDPSPALRRHLPFTPISGGPFYTYPAFSDFTSSGVWGDISRSSAEKGEAVIERAVDYIAEFIDTFRAEPLPDPVGPDWL